MRSLYFLGAILVISTTSVASAQEVNTLDGQLQRLQQGRPAMPAYQASTGQEWSASTNAAVQPGSEIPSEGSGAIPLLPSIVQQAGNVIFINGGIGDEDVAELKARANEFNLHLLISATTGEYISNVHLRVLDANGNAVLSIDDAGPYVYARLTPGVYTLEAAAGSGSKTLKVTVPATGSVKEHFAFSE